MKDELAAKNDSRHPAHGHRRFGPRGKPHRRAAVPTSCRCVYSAARVMLDRFQFTDSISAYPSRCCRSADGDISWRKHPRGRLDPLGGTRGFAEPRTAPRCVPEGFSHGRADRGPFYGDPGCRSFARHLYMSETMPLAAKSTKRYTVRMGYRKPDGSLGVTTGYLRPGADVHEGWMPYTKRTVLAQMFRLLNTPYGWHGRTTSATAWGPCAWCRRAGLENRPRHKLASDTRPVDRVERREKPPSSPASSRSSRWRQNPAYALLLGRARVGKLYFMHQGGWGYKTERRAADRQPRLHQLREHSGFPISSGPYTL